jgi:transcription elongation factor Elf1
MSYTEYFPHGTESVQVRFTCDNCGNEVLSDSIRVPSPDWSAEKTSDSYADNDGGAVCENCGKDFSISVWSSFADGWIDVEDINDEDVLEVIEHPEELDEYYEQQIDAILFNTNSHSIFQGEIENLKKLNEIELPDAELLKTLKRQIYSGTVTCLEVYLSDALINAVLNDDKFFKRFVRTFHGIRNRKFQLSELYEKLDGIKDIVKKELLDVIYHDLPKVKGMYQDTFEIEFPDIEALTKVVLTRHDMVHRNGKTKDGEEVVVDKQTVTDLISQVEGFVNEIDAILKRE